MVKKKSDEGIIAVKFTVKEVKPNVLNKKAQERADNQPLCLW